MFTFTRNIYVITRKNVLRLIDRRNVVVKPRRRLALVHRSTQIWQHVWHDRRGVRLGDAITQRRVITFWRQCHVISARFIAGILASIHQLSSIASVDRTANLHAVTPWVDLLGTRSWCPRLLARKSHTNGCAFVYQRKWTCMLVVVERLASLSTGQCSCIGIGVVSRFQQSSSGWKQRFTPSTHQSLSRTRAHTF